VTLTVRNGGGTHFTTQNVTVSPIPVAAFDMSPAANPVANQVITFTDKSTGGPFAAADIQWHFDDGTTLSGPSVTKAFATPGDHWATLTVKNAGGGTSTSPQTAIHVRPVAPNPTFTYANAGPGKVTFTGSSGGDPIDSWSWNFGDGTQPVTGKTVTHDFTGDGPFTVTLTVTNETASVPVSQTISMATPTVSASVSPAAPTVGQTVTFTNTSTGGPFASVTWSWGDGTTNSSGNSATHAFTEAKTYPVTLTVTNGAGTFSRTIDVVVT
jgi:PKD repeat protein